MLSVELTERIVMFLDSYIDTITQSVTSWRDTNIISQQGKYMFVYEFTKTDNITLSISLIQHAPFKEPTASIKALLTSNKKNNIVSLVITLTVISTHIIDKSTAILITTLGIIKTTFCVDLFNFKFTDAYNQNVINQLTINSTIEETIIATVGNLKWPVTGIEFVEKSDVIEYLI